MVREDDHLEADYEDRQNGGIDPDNPYDDISMEGVTPPPRRVRGRIRGDFIPSISEYSHWNEEAEAMWYAENRYDMEHWDEPVEDDDDDPGYYDED